MHDLKYVASPQPFRDFLLVAHTPRLLDPRRSPERLDLPGHPHLQVVERGRCTLRLWTWGGPPSPDSAGAGWTFLSGYVFSGAALLGFDPADAVAFAQVIRAGDRSATGNFSFVDVGQDAHGGVRGTLLTDPFGLSQLFVAMTGHGTIVSNRYHVAACARHQVTRRSRVDVAALGTALFTDSVLTAQVGTHRMPIEGIDMVPLGTEITLCDGRITMVARPPDTDLNYQSLIERGCAAIQQNVSAVLDHPRHSYTVMNLTGGMDSRILLAAVRSLGRSEEILVDTRRLSDEADFTVAIQLAAATGVRYRDRPAGTLGPLAPAEHMGMWRSQYLGTYHDLSISSNRMTSGADNWGRLIGGCGELYRGFYQKLVPNGAIEGPHSHTIDALRAHLAESAMWPVLASIDRRPVVDLLMDELLSLPGRSLREKLDSSYLHFRNRLHFGTSAAMAARLSSVAYCPLVSPDLLAASRLLPAAQREAGQVIYDVIHHLDPDLAELPFTGGQWLPAVIRQGTPAQFDVDVHATMASWDVSQSFARGSKTTPRHEWDANADALIDESTTTLHATSRQFEFVGTERFRSRLVATKASQPWNYRRWVSRVAGMADTVRLT